jgi:hypothetical protein
MNALIKLSNYPSLSIDIHSGYLAEFVGMQEDLQSISDNGSKRNQGSGHF